ncbi:glycosyltransferase [Halosegnis rubeus]|uniref:Glycosyltransferase n=1 Tax=Halosegnis rubeus TaxID=2212850 RepID=A0A5N5UA17_9EURY|nr:glycosyltransferase family 2 protein [Halosegnis rubeus]KAB7514701.1 glycosyltransferase [Halosegnis rubeus]
MAPLVSVVIPTHYRNGRLADAIESVRTQTYPDVECVVVDDSGEGHAAPVADHPEVTYLALDENRGGNPARTVGIERAEGEYVHLLDDDDRLHPDRIERGMESLRERDASVGFCGFRFENGDERYPRERGEMLETALAFAASPCLTSTLLVEGELLRSLLPLADRPGGDDLGLIIELAQRTRFDAVDELLVTRAVEPDSRGKSMGLIEGRRDIIDEYDSLYEEHPAARKRAVADTARKAGEQLLRSGERRAALGEFWRAFRTQPTPARAVPLASALGGWRVYRASKHLSVRLP